MDLSPEQKADAAQAAKVGVDHKISAWWASLTTKAKKANLRRQERRAAFLAASTSGYCCPKCHRWLPTPVARRECRESHRKAA